MAAAVISFSSGMPAIADLNKFEADTPGEFGIGSAAQFGSADLRSHFFLETVCCKHFWVLSIKVAFPSNVVMQESCTCE